MVRINRFIAWAAPLLLGFSTLGWAALSEVGEPIAPHGFPAYYTDSNGLALEPCLPPPGGYATLDLCVFDPIDPADPEAVALGVGGEIFWWLAEARINDAFGADLDALLVLGLEGTFIAEEPRDGEQMSFGRVRVRIDVPVPGTYTITHPFGQLVFENVSVAEGINYTADLGDANILNPALGFAGALKSGVGPFLTWPDYTLEPALQVLELDEEGEPTGVVLEQYIGNPNIPHVVTGSPSGNNLFRIEGPDGISVETDLFSVMGKVYEPLVEPERVAHVYPDAPPQVLFAVGPVNREGDTGGITPQQPEGLRTGTEYPGYPKGFPLWYQENLGSPGELVEGGIRLTLCPYTDPMCISDPIDPNDPGSVALRIGEEGFWWSADARMRDELGPGLDALLMLGLEATFGGDESIIDGNQIAFGRLRIRIDAPTPGEYTVTHPYGEEVFVVEALEGGREINFTRDIMMTSMDDPDSAFAGALFSDIGPRFLTWTTFNPDPALNDPLLQRPYDPTDPESPMVQYVGNPLLEREVVGSPNDTNHFRIQGPGGIDVQTPLFAVSGKLFDEATFEVSQIAAAPIAQPDSATTLQAIPVVIDILANDTLDGEPVDPTQVVVQLLAQPGGGTAVINPDNTITYTPDAVFDGQDNFPYRILVTVNDLQLVSDPAIVTVNVIHNETISVDRARLELRRLQYDIRGTSNLNGSVLTLYPGSSASGTPLGTVTVAQGRWRLRTTATASPELGSITVINHETGASVTAPLQQR